VERAKERVQFGRPLSAFQAIQFKLADMATQVMAARYMVYSAAWMKDNGVEPVTMNSSMAKLFATEVAFRNVNEAVQIFGGDGVSKGCPVEKLYREVRPPLLYEGTSEIQRIIIARELLKVSVANL
jgi:alkylation response protein AidB-like acyl-CoA dehydrogenase